MRRVDVLRRFVPVRVTIIALLACMSALVISARQRWRPGGEELGAPPMRDVPPGSYDGGFRFCRVSFRNSPLGDGHGWYVDYPRADENLSIRLSELTKTRVTQDSEGVPVHIVLPLTDPELFMCPFVMMTEPGGASFDAQEAAHLRTYLLKGGFLWADDFWGTAAWQWWSDQIGRVLPPTEFPIVDVPMSHPIFHMQFDIKEIPQIPNIGLWTMSQQTSERGADSAVPHFRGIADHDGRLMVVMTHNTDFGDAFERESENPDYFRRFSVPAYAIGVDVILYSMTH